jgi:hypothetical protein
VKLVHGMRLLGAVLGAFATGACESGGTQAPPARPAITMVLSAATAQLLPGESATLGVTITRTGFFTAAVELTAESVPAGVTIPPVTIPAGAATGILTIVAAPGATPGNVAVTVRATGQGISGQTATFSLTVREPPGFTMAVSPGSVTVQPGGSGSANVSVTRTGGFTGPVALTTSGMPAGVGVVFTPASVTTGGSAVTVTAAAGAIVGTHGITIHGNAEGMAERTATLNVQVNPAPTIGITLNPTALSIARGATGTITVTLVRGAGFTGAVNLVAENLPAGVTAGTATIAAGASSALLDVQVSAAAALETNNVTIRALGTGVTDQTATLALTVTVAPDYTLSLTPATITVQQGSSAGTTVDITRTANFTGTVTLSAAGMPAGLTVTFNPVSVTGAQSAVAVAATTTVPTGTYPVTLRATSPGQGDRTATLTVQVTAGTQTGGNVSYRICPLAGQVIWVAAQDGAGGWTRLPLNLSDEYLFHISTTGGVAYVTSNAGIYDLNVEYGTRAELQASGARVCAGGSGPRRTINGTVIGMSATDLRSHVFMGGGFAFITQQTGSNFQLQNVRSGPVDLVASRIGMTPTGETVVNRLLLDRGLNPANNSSVIVDFNGPASFAPAAANLTLNNLGSDHASVEGLYLTANGSYGPYAFDGVARGAATRQFHGFPASVQAAGDFHMLVATALDPNADDPTQFRFATHIFRTLAARTVTFGPSLSPVTPATVTSQPYARLRLSYPVQAEYGNYFVAEFWQDSRSASIEMNSGYLGGTSTAVLEVPDFTGVAGWDPNWGLRAGTETYWDLTAMGWSSSGGTVANPWIDNTVIVSAARSGEITP